MTWWAVGATVVSTGASIYQGNKQRKAYEKSLKNQKKLGSAKEIADQQRAQEKENQIWASDQNKANQLWANEQNNLNLKEQLNLNRPDWGRQGFSSGAWDETNQKYNITLDPTQKANLDILRQKQGDIMSGMGKGFDVQGDVMTAYRNLQQPLVAENRAKQEARLAAMGIPTAGSSAWETSQRSLNDAQLRADQNAILAGFEADQALRESNRGDLGAMGYVEQGMLSGMNTPSFATAGVSTVGSSTVNAPTSDLMSAWKADQNLNQANLAQQTAQNQGIGDIGNLLSQGLQLYGAYKGSGTASSPVVGTTASPTSISNSSIARTA